jgi:DNA polymerase
MPASLEQASKMLGAAEKNMVGAKLMMKMCRPARAILSSSDPKRQHTPENIAGLVEYCHDDVAAEAGFMRAIPMLSRQEERVWRSTWRMNRRGVYVDVPLVKAAIQKADAVADFYRTKLASVTGGEVEKETQRDRLGVFLEDHGAKLPRSEKTGRISFDKNLRHLVDLSEADEKAVEAYDLYRTLNKSSISKFKRILACMCEDGRIRGMFQYSGAGQTARWAGRLVQLQNMPRGIVETEEEYDALIADVRELSADDIEFRYGDAMGAIASAIRPALIPSPDRKFVVADYSAIEGRVLAWLAGEEWVLQAYRDGKRMYAVAAARIFGVTYEHVVAEKKAGRSELDKKGKVAELACGYQGGVGAIDQMGGRDLPHEQKVEIVKGWRASRPKTTALWADLQRAAIKAMRRPGSVNRVGVLAFRYDGEDLKLKLPSGRCLIYRRAKLGEKVWPDGGTTPQIEYLGLDDNNRLCWVNTYGGKLAENATQAVARDLLAVAMLDCEDLGWQFVMTVHDELVAEEPEDGRDHHDLSRDMVASAPSWAKGIPLAAAGFTGQYYRK